jgi:hypothetical protein
VVQLALEVLAFLFLAYVGVIALVLFVGLVSSFSGAIGEAGKAIERLISPHDPQKCPICLSTGHPTTETTNLYAAARRGLSTRELHEWAAREFLTLESERVLKERQKREQTPSTPILSTKCSRN